MPVRTLEAAFHTIEYFLNRKIAILFNLYHRISFYGKLGFFNKRQVVLPPPISLSGHTDHCRKVCVARFYGVDELNLNPENPHVIRRGSVPDVLWYRNDK